MLKNDYIPLFDQPKYALEQVARTPAAALGSVRHKPGKEECERIFDNFKKMNVRYFFYIGGNDSAETAYIVNGFAEEEGYDLRVVHIPKTIDNDLLVTDHCPGYGSAARYVASAFLGDNEDNRALKGVKINVVMGRNAGFLTAASILGRQHPEDGPHLVYLPERPFDLDAFLADVERVYKERGRALIAVSEGISRQGIHNLKPKEKPEYMVTWLRSFVTLTLPEKYLPKGLSKAVEMDSHGNVSLSGSSVMGDILGLVVKSTLNMDRVRADTLGYPQRSFPLAVSETDAREAFKVGVDAVAAATGEGFNEGSIALRRVRNRGGYDVETFVTPLQTVQKETKSFPREWMTDDGRIDEAVFKEYALPLIGELPSAGRFVKVVG
jgi:6-phosphofructokinase 1